VRLTKGATIGLVAVAVLVTAGTGFAAFTSTAYVGGSARTGNLGPLTWGLSPAYGGFAPNDVCTAVTGTTTNPDDTLFLTADYLLPGDICSYGDSLSNAGSLPAGVTEQITSASGPLCAVLVFGDNFFSPSVTIGSGGQTSTLSHVVPATGSIQWEGFIHLPSSAGSSYEGTSCNFVVTLTGTAGT
jgi:hypothetical protein